MNYHKGVKPYKCGECRKSFTEKRVLKRHQSNHRAIKDHNCSMCVRKFADPVQLEIHMTRHKTIKCSVCPFKTTKKADLKKHAKTHEIIDFEPQSCPKCGKNFKVMEKHTKTHARKCISTFRVMELLKGSAPCKRCKNYISQPFWKMKKHITTSHTKEGRFKCTYCEKRFIDSWHLREHERSHTGEKPYSCAEQDCSKAFKNVGNLNRHKVCHSTAKLGIQIDRKLFKCPLPDCTQEFTQKSYIKRHLRIHSGEKPFECPQHGCSSRFTEKGSLKIHMVAHSGEKPFKCQKQGCQKAFSLKRNLYRHENNHHKMGLTCKEEGQVEVAEEDIPAGGNRPLAI